MKNKLFSKVAGSKKLLYIYGSLIAISILVAGVTYAAFTDKSDVLGATFSVGSADLKFISDLTNETDPSLRVDELPGPSFQNVSPVWKEDYLMKLVNGGSSKISVSSHSNYETINDPKDLRSDIMIEILKWDDLDKDGVLDSGEEATSLGNKTITKWKTEGIVIGEYNSGQIIPLILRFTAPSLNDTQQGASGIFDFEFDSIQI